MMTTKLTNDQKKQIIFLIEEKKKHLKSYRSVAVFCGVSPASIDLIRKGKYPTEGDTAIIKIGTALGWKASVTSSNAWVTAPTRDIKSIMRVCADAKSDSLFLAISDNGGMGKSEGLKYVLNQFQNQEVFYLRCMDWGKHELMINLCKTLGIQVNGLGKANDLLQLVVDFFQHRSMSSPLLILDEFNKLKDSAIMMVIPLFNECEDSLGMVIVGPDDLEKRITAGVRHQKKGYDEIYSRFGRLFIKLNGATLNEVIAICKANGYDNEEHIKNRFEEKKPISKIVTTPEGREVRIRVLNDLRWVKILIKVNRRKNVTL
ncbi:MAG: ATP-binding protein [Sphingobacteriia bacterium]|nr:MAG: ATP-binding protein [Sphingobacteriia bacterium]